MPFISNSVYSTNFLFSVRFLIVDLIFICLVAISPGGCGNKTVVVIKPTALQYSSSSSSSSNNPTWCQTLREQMLFPTSRCHQRANMNHQSLVGPCLLCVCCALVITDGTLKTDTYLTRHKEINHPTKKTPQIVTH